MRGFALSPLVLTLLGACASDPGDAPPSRPIGAAPDDDQIDTIGAPDDDHDPIHGDGVPDSAIGVGSCDGVTPAANENEDCDGYCAGVEGALIPCDDGAPPGTGVTTRDPIDPPRCVDNTFDVSAVDTIPPRILLVVDKSGSMNDDAVGFGARKWDAARGALINVVNTATAQFGLMLYPNGTAQVDVCEPGALRTTVGPGTEQNIVNNLNATEPGGGTPTAPTLVEARQIMDALGPDGGTRAIVLATDGGPNCNGSLDGNTCRCVAPNLGDCQNFSENCLDDANAIAAARQVAAAGYPLFVIGIPGSENFVDVLNGMAQAGGTGTVFNATSADALAQQIDAITQVLAGCRFTLEQNIAGASTVTVSVDGAPVVEDAQNGYTLVGDALELHGGACELVQQGAQAGATVAVQICEG